ncbi:MAG: enoyl-CoA hydratase/isomerase family protein [Rhodobacteraceae bacterium]|nr:enoyl-CoA hydratase/isomerase family protein [Paracoccaceae bacterium]
MINFEVNGNIGTITMSRAPVNALDPALVLAIGDALDQAEEAELSVLVIQSDQKCFCAGADLSMIAGYFDEQDTVGIMSAYTGSLHTLFDRIEALAMVTVAVIDGPALGGGLELALSCDLRIVSTRSKIGLPEAGVGLIPGAGGTQRLTRLAGPGVAARIILSSDIVNGTEAERLGIAQWVAQTEDLKELADKVTGRIGGLSGQSLRASKRCMAAWSDPAQDGFALEKEVTRELMPTQETRDRVFSFFKRK